MTEADIKEVNYRRRTYQTLIDGLKEYIRNNPNSYDVEKRRRWLSRYQGKLSGIEYLMTFCKDKDAINRAYTTETTPK